MECGLKVATYNVNSVNARLPVLLRWLSETRPDIVCLQELKAPQDKFPEQAIRDAGYGAIWHGQKSYNGVAILTNGREPRRRNGACRVIRMMFTVGILKRASVISSLRVCICRTAIQRLVPSSTTS